jgi:hypothetical protein
MSAADPYAGDRIAYMNARRARKPASAGKLYPVLSNPVDERSRLASLDAFDAIREQAWARFANQRAIVREFRNSLAAGMTADEPIPF